MLRSQNIEAGLRTRTKSGVRRYARYCSRYPDIAAHEVADMRTAHEAAPEAFTAVAAPIAAERAGACPPSSVIGGNDRGGTRTDRRSFRTLRETLSSGLLGYADRIQTSMFGRGRPDFSHICR